MNDITTLAFLVLFGFAAFLAGSGWQRKRSYAELEELYEKVYGKAYDRATTSLFKTAVRAGAAAGNAAIGRYRPRPAAAPPRLEDDTTVDLARHTTEDDADTVVLPFPAAGHRAA